MGSSSRHVVFTSVELKMRVELMLLLSTLSEVEKLEWEMKLRGLLKRHRGDVGQKRRSLVSNELIRYLLDQVKL